LLFKGLCLKTIERARYVGQNLSFYWLNIVEELKKTLRKIRKPSDRFDAKYRIDLTKQFAELEPNEAKRIDEELTKNSFPTLCRFKNY
jgi:hypothetical protein